jgi:hypothetical protein
VPEDDDELYVDDRPDHPLLDEIRALIGGTSRATIAWPNSQPMYELKA